MKNIKEWKKLIEETTKNSEIVYHDNVSIFVNINNYYVVVEDVGTNLQLQTRKSLDHSDITNKLDIICNNKMISTLTPNNYDDVKNLFSDFVCEFIK